MHVNGWIGVNLTEEEVTRIFLAKLERIAGKVRVFDGKLIDVTEKVVGPVDDYPVRVAACLLRSAIKKKQREENYKNPIEGEPL